ncbi:ATP-dependent Lon protease [Streptomyces sp. NPDC007088]|uniref:ATP-dependent Lon protease n=1 Tax=Streptomyces sp. NPDC007088 TaxID=3364773 RepID=UPI00367D9967
MMVCIRRTHARAGLVGLLAMGLFGAFVPQASAVSYSPWGYYGPVKGYKYKNRAAIADSSRLYASTTAARNGSGNVPAGYLGALARLYKGDALCKSAGYAYNSGPANSLSVPTQGNGCGTGAYYSYGATKAYNGNGYKAVYTFKSPSLNHRSVAARSTPSPQEAADRALPRNARGQTYGSGLDAGTPQAAPDLIRAYTTEGELGYVKRAELEDEPAPASPRQALAFQSERAGKDRRIPVYALDGTTAVGTFVVEAPQATLTKGR